MNEKQADNNVQLADQLAKTRTLYCPPRDYTYFLEDYESFGDELIDNRVRRNPKSNKEYSKKVCLHIFYEYIFENPYMFNVTQHSCFFFLNYILDWFYIWSLHGNL